MGGVASSKSKNDPKLVSRQYNKSPKTKSSKKDGSSKYHSTVYRVSTCKYHEKCPSIKNIKHKHYTIYDLNHLTQYSHPRKHCQYGLKCKYFENVMKGSYSLPDLCHYSIYLHPISRFITSFPKNKKNDDKKQNNSSVQLQPQKDDETINENYIQQSMYNSLQMPRSGEKNGLMSYKKLGIMICDGGCGSSITRGLWKSWNFKDLIWNYKYRRFKKNKDPNYSNKKPISFHKKKHKKGSEDESRKDVNQCLVTMIESVVALAGESFLIQMYDLMMKTKTYLNNDDDDELEDEQLPIDEIKIGVDDEKSEHSIPRRDSKQRRNSKKRNSLLGQNKYIEAFKAEMLNSESAASGLKEEQLIITDEERHNMEFGELLLLFSDIVRDEFGLDDRDYPVIKKKKVWQCPMIYGVLVGMINDKLKLNVETFKDNDICQKDKVYTKSKKRRLKAKRKENIRKEIFIKGCRYSNRDLFKELQINNFTYVLSIPQIKGGAKKKYSKHMDIDHGDASYRGSGASFDDGAGDDDLFDNVSSIVAPNAPPSYRENCVHYKKFNATNFLNYEWSSLQEVAREKLHHPRHLEMGSCLEEEELLSILLLTGTRVGLDLIESHRKYRNYCKWRVLQTNLISALLKLKSHDRTPNSNQFFHGLLRQKKNEEKNEEQPYLSINNIYLFNTFVSTTLDHRLIESSFHNKKDGALLFLDRREPVICADISWISKFPFEHEVLFAPCALTLPSPFEKKDKNGNINRNKNISPKYAKEYYKKQLAQKQAMKNYDEDRERVCSIAEISSQPKSSKKSKKKKKKKGKDKDRDERADSLAGFSLVDGRLEALSYDANDQILLRNMIAIQSPSAGNRITANITVSDDDDSDDASNVKLKNNKLAPTINISSSRSAEASVIDNNLIASFLYGKTTPNALFLYLYQQFNITKIGGKADGNDDELFIDEMCLQSLFQSLFLFAIQIEYETRNNGIKPKYMSKYIDDIYDFSRNYSTMFITKINEESKKYKINTDKITKTQFINNAVYLHQLYEEFIENIIAKEMSLQYTKWDDNDDDNEDENNTKHKKQKIPAINTGITGQTSASSQQSETESSQQSDSAHNDESESEQHDDDDDEDDYDEYDESESESDDNEEDEEEDDDEDSYEDEDEYDMDEDDEDEDYENATNIVENVENIRAFCRSQISLLKLWCHFTEQLFDEQNINEKQKEESRAILMNYIQFDVLVYAALAYFVCERNPNSPLASRASLNPLIDQLRLSLLAAYDPDNNGYVTYNAFAYFGEYLLGEYSKLRGSLAETPRTKQHKYTSNATESIEESLSSVEDDIDDINSANVKGSNDELSDEEEEELEANDLMILNSLNSMEKTAMNIIEFLVNEIVELNDVLKQREEEEDGDEDDELAENICNEISGKTQKLLYLTKEMEIHCNSLKNHNLRYKKAKLINYIDSKREEIQVNFNEIIQVDSD